MRSVAKWSNILLKPCGVYTARFLKYVWPFYNMHERVKPKIESKKYLMKNLGRWSCNDYSEFSLLIAIELDLFD